MMHPAPWRETRQFAEWEEMGEFVVSPALAVVVCASSDPLPCEAPEDVPEDGFELICCITLAIVSCTGAGRPEAAGGAI